jgi:glycosyltransferase involved in cell wall biosynthesis
MTILFLAPEAMVGPLTGGRERARRVLLAVAARQRVHLAVCADETEAGALEALARAAGLAGLMVLPYPGWRGYRGLRRRVTQLARAPSPPFAGVHCVGLDMWPVAQGARLRVGGRRVLELHDLPDVARRGLRAALEAAEEVIVVSEGEAQRVRDWGVPGRVHVVGNGVDLDHWSTVEAVADDEPVMLFPAAFNWPPNEVAARTLVEVVLPTVRAKVPRAAVVLAGRRPGPGVWALARHEGVTLMADPEDMRPLFARARLVVVPTAAAGGTRLKILQALAAGRAVVSTPEGAAGLGLRAGSEISVAPLVEPFADEAARLLNDAAARAALVDAGREAAGRFTWEKMLPALDNVYPE